MRYDGVVTRRRPDRELLLSEPFSPVLRVGLGDLADAGELGRAAELALAGDSAGARAYVHEYRGLVERLVRSSGGSPTLTEGGRRVVLLALEETAAEAPFSRWAAVLGLREGIPLHALSSLRMLLPNTVPLTPPSGGAVDSISEDSARRFLAVVRRSLNASQPDIERVRDLFDLSQTELGALFGVSRQAATGWLAHGVPANRREKLATVASIADLLEQKLKPDRIPGIARRPADSYGGHTMLQLIAADRHLELLDLTRASFDWSAAA